jgi:hypothetical protein
MMDALQMRVLGLPAWAWGAIIGVGVVGISYYRSRNAPADPNSGQTDPNAAVDANGNPIDPSGIASYNPTDASGDAGGYYPGPIGGVGGFNYSTPAPAPNPNARLDPKQAKELAALLRLERNENRKHHKTKRNRKGTSRVASQMRNPVNH